LNLLQLAEGRAPQECWYSLFGYLLFCAHRELFVVGEHVGVAPVLALGLNFNYGM
jgi:hypothetical protein